MSGKELAEGLGIGLAPLIFMFSIGYIGFWLSYAGLKTKDKLVKIALFGMPFYLLVLIFGWTNSTLTTKITLLLLGLIISVISSLLWKNWIRHFLSKILFKHKILNEDGYHTLFDELYDKSDPVDTLAITVTLINGTELIGYLTENHCDLQIGQGKMDQMENIQLYVSEIKKPNEDLEEIEFKGEGNVKELTIIPKQSILHIKFSIKEL